MRWRLRIGSISSKHKCVPHVNSDRWTVEFGICWALDLSYPTRNPVVIHFIVCLRCWLLLHRLLLGLFQARMATLLQVHRN
jgi:hypothetical protein